MIAIIIGEAGSDRLADALEGEVSRLCSALPVWETVAGLCRGDAFSVASARTHLRRFLEADGLSVGIGERALDIATGADARAKADRAKPLFKGDDFSKTDIQAA